MMTRVLPENSTVQHVGLLPSNLPTSLKMTLTKNNHPAILCPPRTNYELGCGSPVRQGDKTPQSKAVFFCPSFFHAPNLGRAIHIMMGLFGQPLRLVAPCRGTSTPFNPVTNIVEDIDDGFTTLRQGITA